MKGLSLVVSVIVFLMLQAAVASRIAIGPIAPDFIVICVVLIGLQRGPVQGSLGGFIIGVVVDLGNPGFLGLNALTKTVVGFAAGRIGEAMSPGVVVLFVVFFVAAFVHDALYYLVYLWPQVGSALYSTVVTALPSALYTAVAGIVARGVLGLLGARLVTPLGKARQ